MFMARPAAEIEPHSRIFSSSWILPGPMRPSVSRSMRTLREGSDLLPDFCIKDLPFQLARHIDTIAFSSEVGTGSHQENASNRRLTFCEQDDALICIDRITFSWGRHELSSSVFTAQCRTLST